MTTQPFVRPGEPVRPPATGGGKIAVDPPIAAPIPPPRSVWGIVLPITLVVGVVGFIVAMYVTGMRSFATGFGIFGVMMLVGMVGMLFRGRGAAQRMSWGELTLFRRTWFSRLDEVRDEVEVQRRQQWQPVSISIGIQINWSVLPGRCGCGTAHRAATSSRWCASELARWPWR